MRKLITRGAVLGAVSIGAVVVAVPLVVSLPPRLVAWGAVAGFIAGALAIGAVVASLDGPEDRP